MEKKLGGCLADKPKSLLFQDGGASLSISLEDISPGWRCKPHTDYQVTTPFQLQFIEDSKKLCMILQHPSKINFERSMLLFGKYLDRFDFWRLALKTQFPSLYVFRR